MFDSTLKTLHFLLLVAVGLTAFSFVAVWWQALIIILMTSSSVFVMNLGILLENIALEDQVAGLRQRIAEMEEGDG